MSKISIFIFVLISSFFVTSIHAQRVLQDGNWEAVILYNRTPFLVKMTPEGKILDFEKELPNNYNELQKFIEKEFGGKQSIYVIKDNAVAEAKQIEEISSEMDPHNITDEEITQDVQIDIVEEEPAVDIEATNEETQHAVDELVAEAGPSDSRKTRESYNFNLVYPGQVAIFNKGQLGRLDEIITIMKSNNDLKLTMEAFASDRSNVSVTVNQNRLQGIQDYLSFRGIGVERINSNGMSIDASKSNTIRILLD
jgi:hypothetical protein